MGPGTIIGLASSVIGLVAWVWAEISFGVVGEGERQISRKFLRSIQVRLQQLNKTTEQGFKELFRNIEMQACLQLLEEPINILNQAFELLKAYIDVRDSNGSQELQSQLRTNFLEACSYQRCDRSIF